MTLDEAREVLGLQADAAPDEVRRAYTGALKRHKPERDPQGFRRVREAFERLQAHVDVQPCAEPPLVPEVSSAPGSDAPVTAPTAPTAEDEVMVAARTKMLAGLNAVLLSDALLILGDHLRKYPRDDFVRWMSFAELEAVGAFVQAIEMLREGARRSSAPIPFLRELGLWKPSALAAPALDLLRADPGSAPFVSVVLVAQKQLEEAERLALEAIGRDAARPGHHRLAWLRAVAGMYERGGPRVASVVMRELDRLIPDDPTRPTDDGRVLTLLLRDLGDVAPDIAPELVGMLGMFIGSPARGAAMLAVEPWLPQRLSSSIAVLGARAPALARLAFPHIDPTSQTGRIRDLNLTHFPRLVGLVALLGGLYIGAVFLLGTVSHRGAPQTGGAPAPRAGPEWERMCHALPSSEACELIGEANGALARGDCDEARQRADELMRRADTGELGGASVILGCWSFTDHVRQQCPTEAPPREAGP